MKKNIYLVQVNSVFGESEKSAYLPYSVGCLAAYAYKSEAVRSNFEIKEFIYLREDIDSIIGSLDSPFLVGFSSYIWNMEYNLLFAKKLREKFPECIIVFGGHNISPDCGDLQKHPFIDVLIHGEGERPFRALLTALAAGKPLSGVANISYRKKNGKIASTKTVFNKTVADFPSPYLDGWFDSIIANNEIKFSLIWETNRGCPNRCAFCDWGLLKSKIKKFPMKRIFAEIEWMIKNKIEYVYCCDANFGILDRDAEITDMFVRAKAEHGFPKKFKTNFTKNRDEFVLMLGKKLYDNGFGKPPTLSFQSLSPTVLRNIGRTNMDLEHFKRLMSLYHANGIPAYSELILGLPGETYDSFVDGIDTLLECGQHKSIGIYPCELLPNSLLGSKEMVQKHGIVTRRMKFSLYHTVPVESEADEYSTIILSTDTMNAADWERAYCYSMLIQSLHDIGLLRCIAIFLHYEKAVAYRSFYEELFSFFNDDSTLCGTLFCRLREFTHGITLGKNAFTAVFEGCGNITWGFEEYIFLRAAEELDKFYDEIARFVAGYGVESKLMNELLRYQKFIVKKLSFTNGEQTFGFDFYSYFENIFDNSRQPLNRICNTLRLRDAFPAFTLDEYGKAIWYGRRDDRLIYTSTKSCVEHITVM